MVLNMPEFYLFSGELTTFLREKRKEKNKRKREKRKSKYKKFQSFTVP
jgi:hypothetical protein